jgi:hypothetical protein
MTFAQSSNNKFHSINMYSIPSKPMECTAGAHRYVIKLLHRIIWRKKDQSIQNPFERKIWYSVGYKIQDQVNDTPNLGCLCGILQMVKILLENGADPGVTGDIEVILAYGSPEKQRKKLPKQAEGNQVNVTLLELAKKKGPAVIANLLENCLTKNSPPVEQPTILLGRRPPDAMSNNNISPSPHPTVHRLRLTQRSLLQFALKTYQTHHLYLLGLRLF